jgi:predicted methyltransferase
MPLVERVHAALVRVVRPGDVAVDATAGHGHDTVALARLVGPTGRVFAFDVQPAALASTTARLKELRLDNVTLLLRNHAELRDAIPPEHHGTLAAVVFNLGYLPHTGRHVVTRPATTVPALWIAAELLRPGGLLSILGYQGHAAGGEELTAVREEVERLKGNGWVVTETACDPGAKPGPHLWVCEKPRHLVVSMHTTFAPSRA